MRVACNWRVINGEPIDCLLDTVIEVTLIPARLVTELPKMPVSSVVRSANGTDIEVLDEVELPVWIENREVLARCIASVHVAEMLLGIDWLETQRAAWEERNIHAQWGLSIEGSN